MRRFLGLFLVLTACGTEPNPVSSSAAERVAQAIDRFDAARWAELGVEPTPPAPELTRLRRLYLGLFGRIPSLAEIRRYESDRRPDRLRAWAKEMVEDPRFAEHAAEHWARALVGTEGGPFVSYRRDLFVDWLSDSIHHGRRFDEMAREMIAAEGRTTDTPAANFVVAAMDVDEFEAKLVARSARAFLGERLDCAQCHDHPFEDHTQIEFKGLSAFFAPTKLTLSGLRSTTSTRAPAVPFGREWLPETGSSRERFAAWLTHEGNRRFARATNNRVIELVFGRAYYTPPDELPEPSESPDLLDAIGSTHGFDLRALALGLVWSKSFARDSVGGSEPSRFPFSPLEPRVLARSMAQARSVRPIESAWAPERLIELFRARELEARHGGWREGEDFEAVHQTQVRLSAARQAAKSGPFAASGRISGFTRRQEDALELAMLTTLTRRPSPEERAQLLRMMSEEGLEVEGLFWSLLSTPEFAWNH